MDGQFSAPTPLWIDERKDLENWIKDSFLCCSGSTVSWRVNDDPLYLRKVCKRVSALLHWRLEVRGVECDSFGARRLLEKLAFGYSEKSDCCWLQVQRNEFNRSSLSFSLDEKIGMKFPHSFSPNRKESSRSSPKTSQIELVNDATLKDAKRS